MDDYIRNFYSTPNIIRIKSRNMKWAVHVARMGEGRNSYKDLVVKSWRERTAPEYQGIRIPCPSVTGFMKDYLWTFLGPLLHGLDVMAKCLNRKSGNSSLLCNVSTITFLQGELQSLGPYRLTVLLCAFLRGCVYTVVGKMVFKTRLRGAPVRKISHSVFENVSFSVLHIFHMRIQYIERRVTWLF